MKHFGPTGKRLNEQREVSPDQVKLGDFIYAVVTYAWPKISVIQGKVVGYNDNWSCYSLSSGWSVHKSRAFLSLDEAKAYREVVEAAAMAAFQGGRK